MGVKRFVPEVMSLFSTNRGDGLRSDLTWGGGGFDGGGGDLGKGVPSVLVRARLSGLGARIGLIMNIGIREAALIASQLHVRIFQYPLIAEPLFE